MAVDLDGVTTVLLPGTGSDNDYVRRAFSAPLRRAGAVLVTPVTIPVANDCPIDVGDTPCPRAAGDSDPPGIATGGQWR